MSCTDPLSAPKASCNIYIMYYNTSTNNISCKYDIPYYEERFILSYSIASNLLLGKLQKIRPYRQGDRLQIQDVVAALVRFMVGIENIYFLVFQFHSENPFSGGSTDLLLPLNILAVRKYRIACEQVRLCDLSLDEARSSASLQNAGDESCMGCL